MSSTPRAAQRPTPAPAPSFAVALPPPTPTPSIRVEAVDFNAYRLESGWTFIQGFVQNAGPAPAGAIEVRVSLIADGDVLVGSAQAHIQPTMLKPGGRGPWLAQVQRPPSFARVRVQVQARPLTDFLQTTVSQEFRIEDIAVRPPDDPASPPTISGAVVNAGQQPTSDVKVTAAIFDRDGALFQVVTGSVDTPQLAPNERTQFRLQPVGRGIVEIPSYELFVEGRPSP